MIFFVYTVSLEPALQLARYTTDLRFIPEIIEAIMTIEEQRRRWEEEILDPTLEKFPERRTGFATSSGIPFPRVRELGGGTAG